MSGNTSLQHTLGALLLDSRHLLFTSTKMTRWSDALRTSTSLRDGAAASNLASLRPSIRIDRLRDIHGYSHATLLRSVFGQTWSQLRSVDPARLRQKDRAWHVNILGERSIDVGGPYRESLSQIVHELEEKHVRMFVPSPNQRKSVGMLQDKYLPNTDYRDEDHMSMYYFLGQLMGVALRSHNPIVLNLPPFVWKLVVGQLTTRHDLKEIDADLISYHDGLLVLSEEMEMSMVEMIGKTEVKEVLNDDGEDGILVAAERSSTQQEDGGQKKRKKEALAAAEEMFAAQYDLVWTTTNSLGGTVVVLLPDESDDAEEEEEEEEEKEEEKEEEEKVKVEGDRGEDSSKSRGAPLSSASSSAAASLPPVKYVDIHKYVSACEKYRLEEFVPHAAAVRRGLSTIVPLVSLNLWTWYELELQVCGTPGFDVSVLQRHTKYKNGLSDNHMLVQWLWSILNDFEPNERQRFLRFVWGRTRLPLAEEGWTNSFVVSKRHSSSSSSSSRNDSSSEGDGGGEEDAVLPEAHTCFNQLDLPAYGSKEVMRERLLFAITFCSSIDTDA